MHSVALLTEKRYINPLEKNWYTKNILIEDDLIMRELRLLNISCCRVAWDDSIDWSEYRLALFRTTWNYFEKFNQFLAFIKRAKKNVSLVNSYEQVLWNLDKRYLLELNQKGINIAPTQVVEQGGRQNLREICEKNGWNNIVIKPCVSAAAWNTYFIKKPELDSFEDLFYSLVQKQNMMIQLFQKNIKHFGEISLMLINGQYSHAVLKRAKPGEFRVQDDCGGSVQSYSANSKEIDFAKEVISCLGFLPTYARVDVVLDNNNNLALSELELIEPEMWFRLNSRCAQILAKAIKEKHF